jgi:hypothetical protein
MVSLLSTKQTRSLSGSFDNADINGLIKHVNKWLKVELDAANTSYP